jgi:hypothetical protein
MHKTWRWIAPIAVAGGLLVSGAIPAADASPAASIITISATSPNYPHLPAGQLTVDGHAVAVYKDRKAATAVVSGTVTTSATNDTATLMAKQFGKKKYTAAGSVALTPSAGSAPYSFKVTPTLATQYEVKVSGTDTATSTPVTVYVTAGGSTPKKYVHLKCISATRCVLTARVYTVLPPSAYKTESGKHIYLYMVIGDPTPPANSTLDKGGSASSAKRVNHGEFWRTLKWIITVHNVNASTTPYPNACTKDTESKDGMGLPGHHGCGNKHVPSTALYLG